MALSASYGNTERFYPSHFILITISISVLVSPTSSFANNEMRRDVITALENNKSLPPLSSDDVFVQDGGGSSNVPIQICDSSQQRKYADLTTVYVDPPCQQSYQGYCGIRRNQNYTLIIKYLPKVLTKSLSVQVSTIDPTFGWETPLWPEFSACSSDFNITCPQSPNVLVQSFLYEPVPREIPAMRALVRVRLLGIDASNIKRAYICRQFNIQVY